VLRLDEVKTGSTGAGVDLDLLAALSNACGLAGDEDEVRQVLRQALASDACEIYTDTIGNLIVRKGNGPVRVMLCAHMDEVGLMVAGYDDNGFLRFKESGGIDPRVLPGRAVRVGRAGVPGVIGLPAGHSLDPADRDKVVPPKELLIDIGARSRDEAVAVAPPGTPVYFATRFERLSDKIVKGKALDDRVGCLVVARALLEADFRDLTLLAVFSVQEEVGFRGAQVAAFHLAPGLALAVDGTSSSDVPGVEPPDTSTHLGEGPAISLLDGSIVMHAKLREHLVALAERHGVPHQYRRLTTAGTDSGGIFLQRTGIPSCTMAVPCRYIHGPSSLANTDDIVAAVRLVGLLLESVDKGEFPV